MKNRIESHVNELFASIPKEHKVIEIKEELLSNLNDKYDDFIANGKSEEEAYSLVVSSIGDIHGLLGDVLNKGKQDFKDLDKKRNMKSLFISIGVSLYVIGMAIMIFFDSFGYGLDDVGVGIMFIIWGIATGFVVYGANMGKIKYERVDDSFVEQYKEKVSKKDESGQVKRALTSALWSIIVVFYLAISLFTGFWEYTWIIFLVGAFLQQLIVYFLTEPSKRGFLWHSMLWSITTVVYFIISFAFDSWAWSWLIFLIAAAIQQVIRLFLLLKKE